MSSVRAPLNVIPSKLELRFHPDEDLSLRCDKHFIPTKDQLIYYSRDTNYAYNGKLYYSITYYVYYTKNLAIGLWDLNSTSTSLGYHDKDIERVRVLYSISNRPEPQFVFFSSHAQEGKWLHYNDVKKTNDGKIVVYVCLNSHAHRHAAGTYMRILGFANDYASDMGKHITPRLVEDNTMSFDIANKEVLDTTWKALTMPFQNVTSLKSNQAKKEDTKNANAK